MPPGEVLVNTGFLDRRHKQNAWLSSGRKSPSLMRLRPSGSSTKPCRLAVIPGHGWSRLTATRLSPHRSRLRSLFWVSALPARDEVFKETKAMQARCVFIV